MVRPSGLPGGQGRVVLSTPSRRLLPPARMIPLTGSPTVTPSSIRPGRTLMRSALLYASGAFGFNLLFQSISLWLVFFYAPPPDAGRSTIVPLAALGLIMGVGRLLDAADDP